MALSNTYTVVNGQLPEFFQKMQKISAPDRGPVLAIKIRKAKKKTGNQLISGLDRLVEISGIEPVK